MGAFALVGLVSAALHPHAGPTGAPVLGLTSTAAHSALLLVFGVVAIAAVGNRRAAITVSALSAVGYLILLFFSSIGAARTTPTSFGFHAADILLHGVLAVVNLALLMWLIPDELGDPVWVPRRRGRRRDGNEPPEAVNEPAAASSMDSPTNPKSLGAAAAPVQGSGAHDSPPQPVSVRPAGGTPLEQSRSQETNEPSAHSVEHSTQAKHRAARVRDPVLSRGGVVLVAVAVLAAVVGIVIWIRRR